MNKMNLVDKLIKNHSLSETEYLQLLEEYQNPQIAERLSKEAVALRKKYYGDKVYTRGLIEFTNYCRNNCYYCGIRGGNGEVKRYRLTKEEILECCDMGYDLGFRTFVLQGGEDPFFTDDLLVDIICSMKAKYPDCAITLSIGEKSYESYRRLREAGADRYLLRHETIDEEHYQYLHPENMSIHTRKECLYQLKELGFQVGAGIMVGSPGQTLAHIAKDLVFLSELQPSMVGMGPFIPHHATKFAHEPKGSVELTLFLLSIVRITLPKVLLPATTALGTVDNMGREKGILAGGNVVMPNLSPIVNRKLYELYDDKICTGDEAAECKMCLGRRMERIGYQLSSERGDVVR